MQATLTSCANRSTALSVDSSSKEVHPRMAPLREDCVQLLRPRSARRRGCSEMELTTIESLMAPAHRGRTHVASHGVSADDVTRRHWRWSATLPTGAQPTPGPPSAGCGRPGASSVTNSCSSRRAVGVLGTTASSEVLTASSVAAASRERGAGGDGASRAGGRTDGRRVRCGPVRRCRFRTCPNRRGSWSGRRAADRLAGSSAPGRGPAAC